MGTDKTDPLKPNSQVSFLSVLVVKFDEGLERVSSSMSAALPLWSKFFKIQFVRCRRTWSSRRNTELWGIAGDPVLGCDVTVTINLSPQ